MTTKSDLSKYKPSELLILRTLPYQVQFIDPPVDLFDWLLDYGPPPAEWNSIQISRKPETYMFCFANKQDAALFKLTWWGRTPDFQTNT